MPSKIWEPFSQEHGLHFEDNRIYGWLNDFYITLNFYGRSTRLHLYLPVAMADQGQAGSIRAKAVRAMAEALREYSLERTGEFSDEFSVVIEFQGTFKDRNGLENFLDDVLSQIAKLGITSQKLCRHCQKSLEDGGVPVQIRQDVFPVHESCANAIIQEALAGKSPKGSLLVGTLWAALAAVVGAVLWAVMDSLGFYASITGIIFGFFVSMGYRLLRGRKSRAMIVIVLLFVLLSVSLGQVAAISYQCVLIYKKAVAGLAATQEVTVTLTQYLRDCWTTGFLKNAEFMRRMLRDIGVGVLFTWLSSIAALWNLVRKTSTDRPKKLTSSL